MLLDRKSPTPLYAQLQTLLENKITSREWKPGTQIPTEGQLCKEFDVSRITVRQALTGLENDGLVTRKPGSGTYVNEPTIKLDLGPLSGFTQDMLQKNMKPGAKVLEISQIAASMVVATKLGLPVSSEVYKIVRLRTTNNEPMAIETVHLNCLVCPNLADRDLTNVSLYQLLTEEFGLIPSKAIQQVQAIPCPEEFADVLEIQAGNPVLRMTRRTDDQHGNPLEWVISYYRGDRYTLEVELRNE